MEEDTPLEEDTICYDTHLHIWYLLACGQRHSACVFWYDRMPEGNKRKPSKYRACTQKRYRHGKNDMRQNGGGCAGLYEAGEMKEVCAQRDTLYY